MDPKVKHHCRYRVCKHVEEASASWRSLSTQLLKCLMVMQATWDHGLIRKATPSTLPLERVYSTGVTLHQQQISIMHATRKNRSRKFHASNKTILHKQEAAALTTDRYNTNVLPGYFLFILWDGFNHCLASYMHDRLKRREVKLMKYKRNIVCNPNPSEAIKPPS